MSIQEILMKIQDKKMEQVIWWFSHHLPPHPIPLGCPSAPALSALSHASNLD